ncbi:MAG: DMT family transporter [Alphaproteobacteria bacterium]
MRRSESGRGIAYMLLAMFLMAAVDAQAKYLSQSLPVLQVAWFRQLGLFLGVLGIIAVHGVGVLATRRPALHALRGTLAVGSSILFIVAITYVPLVDAVAVSFVAPLVVTVLGALVLREPVGIRRWLAVIVGFAGAMIVLRPGLGVVHPAALLVLAAAVLFAARQVLSRVLSDTEGILTTLAYTAITGTALLTLSLPFVWQTPQTWTQIALLASMGALAGIGELFVIKALEVAQAVVVAPVQYTMLLWSTGYGYLLFADLPDLWTLVGSLVVVASGIYTFQRERSLAAAQAAPPSRAPAGR